MPKTIIFGSELPGKKDRNAALNAKRKPALDKASHIRKRLPKEVPLLGPGFNYQYKVWYTLLEKVSMSDDDKATENSSRVDDILDLALSELHAAQLRKEIPLKEVNNQKIQLIPKVDQQILPDIGYFQAERKAWNTNHCRIYMMREYLKSNDRLEKIIDDEEGFGKAVAYIHPDRILEALTYALALAEFANANEMVGKNSINEMIHSIYEATYAQGLSVGTGAISQFKKHIKIQNHNNGKKGASIRATKFEAVKTYALELATSMEGKSANYIAHRIKELVMIKARSLNAALSDENAQKTIQKYILAHRNKSL